MLILSLLLLCVGLTRSFALEAVEGVPDSALPADFSRVHFYLITVDVSDNVWDNFGHTALRVVNETDNTDTVYNWGLFDTSGGIVQFSFNFFRGIMNYQLGTGSPGGEFGLYRQQQRTVWQDTINLSNREKEILYRRLLWNIRPENIVYPYQYFFDNCTTRVRDYLDEALMGKIHAATEAVTDNTFRDLVKVHYRSTPLIEFSLDLMMSANIDRPVSQWEEMFLPLSLRARLMGLMSDVAIAGERQPLLSDPTVIMEFSRPPERSNPYYLAGTFLLAPALFLLLLLRKVSMSYFATHSRITLKAPGFSFRLLGVVGLVTSLFSGIYGCLMLGGWFFSGHVDLYSNVNLLLCWPTDLLGILVAGRWLLLASPWPLTHNSAPFINYYMLARLFSVVAYAVIAGFQLTAQSVFPFLVTVTPGLFLLILLIWIVGFEPAKSKNLLL
ncbi:MAG: DUF4105 domain-containing protein [Gammaproteobacteria bacterium]|nr:DUF4105 domain-containing protein [Pseudomonadales bacterium]MCP5345404.1 DUF4105 domain-containing protein [Pseudomonadales bacterium]